MNRYFINIALMTGFFAYFTMFDQPVKSQIIPDKSLGKNSTRVVHRSKNKIIKGGLIKNNNVFHSFSIFNIKKGENIYFAPDLKIKNIFSRVVGPKSSILGTVGIHGNSNLILINSNGIHFGNKSKIDTLSSVLITTASRLNFDNNSYFSGRDLKYNLNSSINSSNYVLDFSNSSDVSFRNLPINFSRQLFLSSIPNNKDQSGKILGLNAGIGKSFSVASRNINFDGGIINSSSGDINLVAIKKGLISVTSKDFLFGSYDSENLGNIFLRNLSQLNLETVSDGSINIFARILDIESGSYIKHTNLTKNFLKSKNGINIYSDILNISSDLDLSQYSVNEPIRAGILSNAIEGKGADIDIESAQINIQNGGGITTASFNNSIAGDIRLNSKDRIIVSDGFKDSSAISAIRSIGTDQSSVGKIRIDANSLKLLNSGTVSTYAINEARFGEITINVDEDLIISGINPFFSPFSSIIQSLSLSQNNAADINIKSKNISILDGGGIGSTSGLGGNTGRVNIDSKNIILSGKGSNPSDIFSEIVLPDSSTVELVTQLTGITEFPLSANTSNVNINAKKILIENGAAISVLNQGSGDAGLISIVAEKLSLFNKAKITSDTNIGDGGNIFIESDFLDLNNSTITSNAEGFGLGGNIRINTDLTTLNQLSLIQANANNNKAGNIQISSNTFLADPSSDVTATSSRGVEVDGSIETNIQNTQAPKVVKLSPIKNMNIDISQICGFDGNRLNIKSRGEISEIIKNPDLVSAWNIQQRYLKSTGQYFRDSETGEIKPVLPVLALEYLENGEIRSIYNPQESEYVSNLLFSLERECDDRQLK